MNKVFASSTEALDGIVRSGQLLAVGGFGLCGIPEALIDALERSGASDLTVISTPVSTTSVSANCWPRARSGR